MVKPEEYQDLVKRAEAAVQAVKDPELRRVAFEKVLDDLLSGAPARSKPKTDRAEAKKPAGVAQEKTKSEGPQGYVQELVDDGFFKKPKTIAQVKAELENRGHHIPLTSLSGPLQRLCQRKMLRRHRAKTNGDKQTFNYSNW